MTLAAHCLSKRYAGARGYQAVRGASLELAAGEFVSIVGRSGSGKSTLLAMLGALAEPSEGKVLIGNTDIWKLQEAERATVRSRGIGFVFQFPSLVSNLSVAPTISQSPHGRSAVTKCARACFVRRSSVTPRSRHKCGPGDLRRWR